MYDEDSESTAHLLQEELLFVEQNVQQALAANFDETNNWPTSASRINHVYSYWVSAGRPSALAIECMVNLEVDHIAGEEPSDCEDEGISALEKIISEGEKSITMYKTMAATESEESAAVLWHLIKTKTKEILDVRQKMAAFHEAPRVKHYSPFTIEKCTHTLAVIEAAQKMVHDFVVDENVDPTMVQCLFQAKLITNTKTSSWDA